MLGAVDVVLIFVVTMISNIFVEVVAEIVAEWFVNGHDMRAVRSSLSELDAEACVAAHRDALTPVAEAWSAGQLQLVEAALRIHDICNGFAIGI